MCFCSDIGKVEALTAVDGSSSGTSSSDTSDDTFDKFGLEDTSTISDLEAGEYDAKYVGFGD